MATERFNRQFVLIDFEDLDNADYLAFMRSPEFSTYMVMRRYIWRSEQEHAAGLHEYYARGHLVCSLYREALAKKLGISAPSITRDIASLLKRGAIESIFTGRQNIYILGRWGRETESNVYYEVFYMDRLIKSDQAASSSGSLSDHSQEGCLIKSDQAASSEMITINRESNIEINKDNIAPSKELSDISSISKPEKEIEELVSSELENLITTCSREFDDMIHIESNLTRAFNLWAKTRFNETEMLAYVRQARETTKQRIGSSVVRNRQKKMAYFFRVLEDVLGLKQAKS